MTVSEILTLWDLYSKAGHELLVSLAISRSISDDGQIGFKMNKQMKQLGLCTEKDEGHIPKTVL